MEIDIGIGGLEFGSGVTRFPGLVYYYFTLPLDLPLDYNRYLFHSPVQLWERACRESAQGSAQSITVVIGRVMH